MIRFSVISVISVMPVVAVRNYKAQDVKGGLGRGGQLKVGS
ncbi:hypothetical protein [Cupriavidus basilensis]